MTSENEARDVSMQEMYAVVGSLFFMCATVERELLESINALGGDAALPKLQGMAQILVAWAKCQQAVSAERPQHKGMLEEVCTHLDALKEIRNRFAHGLIGGQAGWGQGAVEASLTTELNGERLVLTYTDMQDRLRMLSRMRNVIAILTNTAKEADLYKADQSYAAIRENFLPPSN